MTDSHPTREEMERRMLQLLRDNDLAEPDEVLPHEDGGIPGDLAEIMVAADLLRRGHKIAIPYGEDWDYDLILRRDGGRLERIQCKYTRSDGAIVIVRCRSHSLTSGRIRATKHYTQREIDWIAVYDATTDRCYYVPAAELGDGRCELSLRLAPSKNNQRVGIRPAVDYLRI